VNANHAIVEIGARYQFDGVADLHCSGGFVGFWLGIVVAFAVVQSVFHAASPFHGLKV
jgi:hypothetical protein